MKTDISHLMTFTEYGKSIGVSRQRVYQMVNEGKLAFVIIGGIKFINIKPKKDDNI